MAGGQKNVTINTQERAVSVDINRLQSFMNASQAEAMRYLMDASLGSDDLGAGGVITEYSTLNTPLQAEILNGIQVQPQIGSLNIIIAPGVVQAIAPDGSETPVGSPALGDSSYYKYIRDVGVQTLGALAMTPNSSGQIRIDVIECQVASLVSETDNRDVFNPSTGLFAASTVTKATQDGLSYRVRAGTPGSGFPGSVNGWLPLAVASVPTGTTTNDTITFWDVRPLVSARIIPPFNTYLSTISRQHVTGRVDSTTTAGKSLLMAAMDVPGIFPSSTRLGGASGRGTPGSDIGGTQVDLQDTANVSGTFSTGAPCYLYLLEPFGLPRWARYTDAVSGSRLPRSPRGILVLSATKPTYSGIPSAPIALPSSTGLAGTASSGVCVVAGFAVSGSGGMGNIIMDGRVQWPSTPWPSAAGATGAITGTTGVIWSLAENTTHPPNARGLHIGIGANLNISGSPPALLFNPQIQLQDASNHVFWESGYSSASTLSAMAFTLYDTPTSTGGIVSFSARLRIPLISDFPSPSGGPYQLVLNWNATGSGFAGVGSPALLWVEGYELN